MEELFDDPNCEGGPNSSPLATFFVSEDSGRYHVEVIKVSRQAPLEDFSFFLKNESGSTFVGGNGFGEVAMQYLGGDPTGIDMSYSGNNQILQNRASEIANDDGSVYPCTFLTTTKMVNYLLEIRSLCMDQNWPSTRRLETRYHV